MVIVKDYMLPEILEAVGYKEDIIMNDDTIEFIIDNYTYEAGVRKLKEKIYDIIRDVNLQKIQNDLIDFPIIITVIKLKKFSDKPQIPKQKVGKNPYSGAVNGLFATRSGIGGILMIQALKHHLIQMIYL